MRLIIPASDLRRHADRGAVVDGTAGLLVVCAARQARVTFGKCVVVMDAGLIGNLHVQLLRTIEVVPVIAPDISADCRAMVPDCGTDVGTVSEDLRKIVMQMTDGRGADIVIASVGHPVLYAKVQGFIRTGDILQSLTVRILV